MNEYQEIVFKLKAKGIEFDLAMSSTEVSHVEGIYGITFPNELKFLFAVGVPTSKGFYNWRDMSATNVENMKHMLVRPILGLQDDLKDDYDSNSYPHTGFWCDTWGEKPNNFGEAQEVLLHHYICAPPLVPVYGHRYIPSIPGNEKAPVFSIMGSDIICYGENLIAYLETEFKIKEYDNNMSCKYISFWSDLL
jgi:hypothetical protein